MKKILVVSDSHGDFAIIKILEELETPDYIIHAGDHGFDEYDLQQLKMIYVCGNNDYLGEIEKSFEIEGIKFCLCHSHTFNFYQNLNLQLLNYFQKEVPKIIIYGHTHQPKIEKINDVYIINPGALMYPKTEKSYIIMEIDDQQHFNIKLKYFN